MLSIINKVFEKLMYSRLYKFLTKHNILYLFNLAFVKNHSTSLALIEIVDYIRQSIEDPNYTLGIYLDLTKAFDTVDHTILLKKLHHYRIRGITNDWFKSYLTDRKQYTLANGETSDIANKAMSSSGNTIWDRTLFGTVLKNVIFCFDSLMSHMVL